MIRKAGITSAHHGITEQDPCPPPRLSRYPTRTAPTDPGHADTRIRPAPAHMGPLTTAQPQG
jgi:hypothetical protein